MSSVSRGCHEEGAGVGKRRRGAALGRQRRGTWRRERGGVLCSGTQLPATPPPHRPMQPAAAGAGELFEGHPPLAEDTGPRVCQPGAPSQRRPLRHLPRCRHDHRYRRPPRRRRRRRRARRRRPRERLPRPACQVGSDWRCRCVASGGSADPVPGLTRLYRDWFENTCNMPSVTERTSADHEFMYLFCQLRQIASCQRHMSTQHWLAHSRRPFMWIDERSRRKLLHVAMVHWTQHKVWWSIDQMKWSSPAPPVRRRRRPPAPCRSRPSCRRHPRSYRRPCRCGTGISLHRPLSTPCVPRC